MPTDCIPFRDTNYFSSLICDYLDEHQELQPFYNRFPKLENFKDQINEKATSYSTANRNVLFSALKNVRLVLLPFFTSNDISELL